jgi:hypothetical protein
MPVRARATPQPRLHAHPRHGRRLQARLTRAQNIPQALPCCWSGWGGGKGRGGAHRCACRAATLTTARQPLGASVPLRSRWWHRCRCTPGSVRWCCRPRSQGEVVVASSPRASTSTNPELSCGGAAPHRAHPGPGAVWLLRPRYPCMAKQHVDAAVAQQRDACVHHTHSMCSAFVLVVLFVLFVLFVCRRVSSCVLVRGRAWCASVRACAKHLGTRACAHVHSVSAHRVSTACHPTTTADERTRAPLWVGGVPAHTELHSQRQAPRRRRVTRRQPCRVAGAHTQRRCDALTGE